MATSLPYRSRNAFRSARAEASGSTGSRTRCPLSTLDASIPADAITKPWYVWTIRVPPRRATVRAVSRASTTAPSTGTPLAAPTPTAPPAATEGTGAGNIVLTGLREDVQAGLTYPLILTFERAGEVRFDIPVANPDTLRDDGHA